MKPKGKGARWTAEQDKKLEQIVERTLRAGKTLKNAWRRGGTDIEREHDHDGAKDPNRPCPACEDRWTNVLKKQIDPDLIKEWRAEGKRAPQEAPQETLQETP